MELTYVGCYLTWFAAAGGIQAPAI